MSAKAYNIRNSLLELTTCLETRFSQYVLIKNREIENLKAQIETYKVEVDLLRQENFELDRGGGRLWRGYIKQGGGSAQRRGRLVDVGRPL